MREGGRERKEQIERDGKRQRCKQREKERRWFCGWGLGKGECDRKKKKEYRHDVLRKHFPEFLCKKKITKHDRRKINEEEKRLENGMKEKQRLRSKENR